MNSRRGAIFFWIVQALLLPVLVCLVATACLKLHVQPSLFRGIGATAGAVQIPAAALAVVFLMACAEGQLLTGSRLRFLYSELALAGLMITLLFFWRDVYRR